MISIRFATTDDAASICQLNRNDLGYEATPKEVKARMERAMRAGDKIFVAAREGTVIGYIHIARYDTTLLPPLKNILALAVAQAERRAGVGRALLEAAEAFAKAEGCAGVCLVSGISRKGAHAFYLRCGYADRKDQKSFVKMFS